MSGFGERPFITLRIGIRDPLTGWDGQSPPSLWFLTAPALCPAPCWGALQVPMEQPPAPSPSAAPALLGARDAAELQAVPSALGNTAKTCLRLHRVIPSGIYMHGVEACINVVVYSYTLSWSSQCAACLLCCPTV